MMKYLGFGLVAVACASAHAEGVDDLGLGAADLERLGVVMQRPVRVEHAEVASGTAEVVIPPDRQAIVTSAAAGVLSRLLVAEGDFVTAGQEVAEITSADLLQLQREYVEAAVAADLANQQLERDRSLLEDGIIAERRVRDSQGAVRTTSTALHQLGQQLALAGISDNELRQLRDTGALRSTLELTAPFDGFVIEQYAGVGARVDALDPVYRLADLSKLWLEIHVPQERSENVRPGMRVTAATSSGAIEGTVTRIGPVADSASQTRIVRAEIDNEQLDVLVGRFLTARILDAGTGSVAVFAVPSAGVVRVDGGAWIFGRSDGAVGAWPVDVVAEDGINSYVRGDFDDAVEIAVDGAASLKSVWLAAQADGE